MKPELNQAYLGDHTGKTSPKKLLDWDADFFDAVVTDPPYELGFMGKAWDSSGIAYDVEMWKEVLRVMKPGAYLLAFGGTRTQHRMVCAIEDAGFEIRDQMQWIYATGFPKSLNVSKAANDKICSCEEAPEHDVRSMSRVDIPEAVNTQETDGQVLFQVVPEQGAPQQGSAGSEPETGGKEQSGMEGRRDDVQEERELLGGPLRSSPGLGATDGAEGRLCDGAPSRDGEDVRIHSDQDRGGEPQEPCPESESTKQPRIVPDERGPQARGVWPICGRCLKPTITPNLGTALKPSNEPICLARKPLSEPTVAANVLRWGTGALNIDASRIPIKGKKGYWPGDAHGDHDGVATSFSRGKGDENAKGRWPANVILDEEAGALLDLQSGELTSGAMNGVYQGATGNTSAFGKYGFSPRKVEASKGGASRFFYCPKPSTSEREMGVEGGEKKPLAYGNQAQAELKRGNLGHSGESGMNTIKMRGNTHPTVKPVSLMRYLIRLVTPPGGVVLDPYIGSGSTGIAAKELGHPWVGVDADPEFIEITTKRTSSFLL